LELPTIVEFMFITCIRVLLKAPRLRWMLFERVCGQWTYFKGHGSPVLCASWMENIWPSASWLEKDLTISARFEVFDMNLQSVDGLW